MEPLPIIYTVGHSTRPLAGFLALLKLHKIETLVDIRRYPGSRRNPQFSSQVLASSLAEIGIVYTQLPGLGGRRMPLSSSADSVWKNAAFRGYADHMSTPEFEEALSGLLELAGHSRVALMCAEAVPWRCHRTLVADAVIARGREVQHIISETDVRRHNLTSFARIDHGRVTYARIAP
ncbi:MAG TPA: DUF488 domain-containing protein [Dehalococcoidia bacterium]|nr:DUF488 domain-containing protein [Dehalococcoidia bacterium]